jgi:hypothetical protein
MTAASRNIPCVIPTYESDYVELTEEEWIAAARATLAASGFTYAELSRQAAAHRFENVAAKLTWMALIGYEPEQA